MAEVLPTTADGTPIVQGQPTTSAVPMAQAVPVPQAVAVPMGVAPGAPFTRGEGYTPVVPAEKWSSELCDWCGAGQGMCCAAYCCNWVTGAQLYEKVLAKKGACMRIAPTLLVIYVVRALADTMLRLNPVLDEEGQVNLMFIVYSNVYWVSFLLLTIGSTYVLMHVRKRIREKDRIGTGCCGESEDCCCAFWCGCCVNIQIFSHLNMRCDNGYQLCAPEGIPTGGPQV